MISRHLRILGRVQGVGFRYALQDEAERRGVTGWARNRADGSVETVLQGNPEAVEEVLAWARQGPRAARVTELEVAPAKGDFDQPYARFELLPTL